jgi:PucR-like helix-turn-helix protein
VRIIAAFDQLVLQHAEIGGIVRTAAAVAKCKAGLWDPVHSLFIHVGVDGRDIEDDRAVPTRAAYAPLEGTSGGEVWLERAGGPGPLDDIVVERMATAAMVVLERMYGDSHQRDGGGLESLLNERLSEMERIRAARVLGFDTADQVRAVALAQQGGFGHGASSGRVACVLRDLEKSGEIARAARLGDLFAILTTASKISDPLPVDLRAGIGRRVKVLDSAESWATARAALRFTAPLSGLRRAPSASADELGSAVALAAIPPEDLIDLAELKALDDLAATTNGCDVIAALEAFVKAGSLRRAATELHLHHTSVASRLKRAGEALGYTIEVSSCGRAQLALTLWQLKRGLS